MKRFGLIIDKVAAVAGYFCGVLVLLLVFLVFAEVFMRYVVHQPLMIADEIGAYVFVAVVFLGGAYAWQEESHVRITFLVSRLPQRVAKWLRLATLGLAATFAIGLVYASYSFLQMSFKIGFSSATSLHIPLQGPHLTVAVGFFILALLLVSIFARSLRDLTGKQNSEVQTR